ncbi:MAG: hypothetical protein O3C28_17045 [Proteobacteria bacterium]|nr:hypothetical protein [Pseudomonadota bacterium]
MSRYYTLITYSGLLAAVGFIIGKVVQENKGARTFLALAVCAVGVNYAVLGAMTYSIGNENDVIYPTFASWTAPGVVALLAALTAGLLILTPITYFAFSVFARQSAKRFTMLYVAANLALLIPVRSSLAVGLIALSLVILVLRQIVAARRIDSALATREGHFVIAAQFLPVAILVGRNFYFYAVDEFMLTLGAVIVYAVARQIAISARLAGNNASGSLLRIMQVLSAIAVAFGCAAISVATNVADALLIPLVSIVFSSLLIDISLTSSTHDAGYRRTAAIVFATGITLNLFNHPGLATALIGISAGLCVAVYGYSVEQKSVFVSGMVALLSGIVYQLHDVVLMFDFGSWGSLALVGVAAIVLGSLLERYGLALRNRALAWRSQFAEWDY